ncbi:hypothetical protein HZA99_05090 [Candidatus Woesearchaeota archaeon]|nr:hypothetical protein [Candidatus Woesearchaeota archaeon]
MSLEHVKKELKDHAEQEAHKLVAQAKELAKKEMDYAHEGVDAFETEIQAALQKELEVLERRYEAGMKLAAKKVLLEKRKQLLEETFAEAKETIRNLPKAEKTKMLSMLFDRAKKECTVGKVYCAKQDTAIVKTFASQVAEEAMLGGIIVENKEGTMRVDESFDAMMKDIQEKKLQKVAEILFKENLKKK